MMSLIGPKGLWLCMRLLVALSLSLHSLGPHTPAEAADPTAVPPNGLSPDALFEKVAPSVFIVERLGPDGKVWTRLSGVAIAPEDVVTMAVAAERATGIRVGRGAQTWAATIDHWDAEHRLVQLRVPGLTARPVSVRLSATLRVGERVYAIGSTLDQEIAISEGVISRVLSPAGDQLPPLILTTTSTPIQLIQGWLFDAQGRLIGQPFGWSKETVSEPADWIPALRIHPARPISGQGGGADEEAREWLMEGLGKFLAYDRARAIIAYREALRLKPDFAEAWFSLGVAHSDQREYAEAIKAYREALRLKPDDATTWHLLGFAYGEQNQYASAVIAYREALRLNPDLAEAWFRVGNVHAKMKQHEQAVSAYREAIRLKPDLIEAWYNLGLVYNVQGERSRVSEVYQQLKILNPAKAEEFFMKAVLP